MECSICPRKCHVDRTSDAGFCGALDMPVVAKHFAHRWEEPPISGSRGSGCVFFTGCNLRCVYCQNYRISQQFTGEKIPSVRLVAIFLELQSQGAHNINLVTPTHFAPQIADAIRAAKSQGLSLPIVYNSNAYESAATLKLLDGLVDIYLPDLKYFDDAAALKYSGAAGYFEKASAAILEMWRQVGALALDADGLAQRGLIVRHLVLPGMRKDSMRILDWISDNIPQAHVSLMAQYLPQHRAAEFPEINRRVTRFEYDSVVEHFFKLGLRNGFIQDMSAAAEEFIPEF